MEKKILIWAFLLFVGVGSFVFALQTNINIIPSYQIIEAGEEASVIFEEDQLQNRNDWTYEMIITKNKHNGEKTIIKKQNGTLTDAKEILTINFKTDTLPENTEKWHGKIANMKYTASIYFSNTKTLDVVGMAKPIYVINSREKLKTYISDDLKNKINLVIGNVDTVTSTTIPQAIEECKTGEKTDEETAEKWELLMPKLDNLKTDLENINTQIDLAAADITLQNCRNIDIAIGQYASGENKETINNYFKLTNQTIARCLE
ncbi:MAG: hypothetical protein B6U87_03105 [Candidatus Aenigmarchaeota archaeon ex4484_52]|nr:MAG: hypothetical protein B6U87_03105 [Candidatus Aenigmarchaeota archaeon ex4484_52]